MDKYSPTERLSLFPATAQLQPEKGGSQLSIGGCDLEKLAREFGTPLYLYDQATLDEAVDDYRQALQKDYPGPAGITYAGKAFLCIAMAQWVRRQGLWLDCTGLGELAVATEAGLPRSHIVVHGVNKDLSTLATAMRVAGTVVVDNLTELSRIVELAKTQSERMPNLWLRLRPGATVETHAYIQTGQRGSKFGMSVAEIVDAVGQCLEHQLPVNGLHFHLGSHLHAPAALGPALDVTLDSMLALKNSQGWLPEVVSPGGGWGMAYHESDLPHPPVSAFVQRVAEQVNQGCLDRGIPTPRLQLEPGRSLVARAGIALYRIGATKRTEDRRWLLVDGGLADNPRTALYSAQYSALPVRDAYRDSAGAAWIGGPYCESGDVLIADIELPDLQPGELLAVPTSGAYQLSMASNYNLSLRPAVLWLAAGRAHLVQSREEISALYSRDHRLWQD